MIKFSIKFTFTNTAVEKQKHQTVLPRLLLHSQLILSLHYIIDDSLLLAVLDLILGRYEGLNSKYLTILNHVVYEARIVKY